MTCQYFLAQLGEYELLSDKTKIHFEKIIRYLIAIWLASSGCQRIDPKNQKSGQCSRDSGKNDPTRRDRPIVTLLRSGPNRNFTHRWREQTYN